jgi:hypothetical protein
MSAYDLETRRLCAREYAERLRSDARRPLPRRRRSRLRQLLQRELPLLSAARRHAASLRLSS